MVSMTRPMIDESWIDIAVDEGRIRYMLAKANEAIGGQPLRAFFATAHASLMSRARARFASEGDSASGKWAQLSSRTVEERIRQGFPGAHPINKRTGELENYILNTPSNVTITPVESTMVTPGRDPEGDAALKFQVAQHGSRRTPKRPVLAVDARDMETVLAEFTVYLTAALR